jgi:hypothetical protein
MSVSEAKKEVQFREDKSPNGLAEKQAWFTVTIHSQIVFRG